MQVSSHRMRTLCAHCAASALKMERSAILSLCSAAARLRSETDWLLPSLSVLFFIVAQANSLDDAIVPPLFFLLLAEEAMLHSR